MISSSAAVHLLTWRQLVVLQQRQVRDATRRLQCHNQRPCWRRVLLLYCISVCRHLENLQRRSDLHCFCTCRSVVASLFIKKAHAYLTYTGPTFNFSWGYYSNTRGLSRVPVYWYMLKPSLGEKNVRMTTGNCVLTGKLGHRLWIISDAYDFKLLCLLTN